jgi:hypothetical protein
MGRAELEAKPDRSSQADDRSQGRVALLRCQEPPDRFWRSTSTAGQVGLAQANAFAGIVDLAHESIDRVDLGPRLHVRGSEVRVFHPALNVPVESGLGARHTRNISRFASGPSQPPAVCQSPPEGESKKGLSTPPDPSPVAPAGTAAAAAAVTAQEPVEPPDEVSFTRNSRARAFDGRSVRTR